MRCMQGNLRANEESHRLLSTLTNERNHPLPFSSLHAVARRAPPSPRDASVICASLHRHHLITDSTIHQTAVRITRLRSTDLGHARHLYLTVFATAGGGLRSQSGFRTRHRIVQRGVAQANTCPNTWIALCSPRWGGAASHSRDQWVTGMCVSKHSTTGDAGRDEARGLPSEG
jgi:hypothetical protein